MNNKAFDKVKNWIKNGIEVHPDYYDLTKTLTFQPYNVDTLKKVWNDGRGLLSFIHRISDSEIIVNELLCNKSDKQDFEYLQTYDNITVHYVELGYPDYYSMSLLDKYREFKEIFS